MSIFFLRASDILMVIAFPWSLIYEVCVFPSIHTRSQRVEAGRAIWEGSLVCRSVGIAFGIINFWVYSDLLFGSSQCSQKALIRGGKAREAEVKIMCFEDKGRSKECVWTFETGKDMQTDSSMKTLEGTQP